ERGAGAGEPTPATLGQHSARVEQPALQSERADSETGEEVDGVLWGEAGLKGEWAELHPFPRREYGRERQVSDRRDAHQSEEEATPIDLGLTREAGHNLTCAPSQTKKRR